MTDAGSDQQQGFVYVIGVVGDYTAKIGYSINPRRRFEHLQTGSPVPLKLLWTHPGDEDLEQALHRWFGDIRSHGEWFRFTTDPVKAVQEVIESGKWKAFARRPLVWDPTRTKAGIYRLYDGAGQLLYIGYGKLPEDRINAKRWMEPWGKEVATSEIQWCDTLEEAKAALVPAIRSELPRYNRRHHPAYDDKPYSWYKKGRARAA